MSLVSKCLIKKARLR